MQKNTALSSADKDEDTVRIPEDQRFAAETEALIREAEDMRLRYMNRHRNNQYVSMTVGMWSLLAGAGGFGWFLLMQADLHKALACIILAVALPLLLMFWSNKPLKDYTRDYKRLFMPKMAAVLGLKYHPVRGINADVLGKTGVVPAFDLYEAEDCFVGKHKGVKIILSEARLTKTKGINERVFRGVLVLMEIPVDMIEGHTIITADTAMAQRSAQTRWKKLLPVPIKTGNPSWDRFDIFSDKPEDAQLMVGEKLLKELAEVADIFSKSPLSAVLFRKRYLFMMIPYEKDMFEASNIQAPVTTRDHAMACKREVERLIEIIDVLEIYKTRGS